MNKFTFKDLVAKFNTEQKCIAHILKKKYKGDVCPVCGQKTKFYKVKNVKYHFDTRCQHRFSILANTSLKGNRTPLTIIFHIIFLLSIAKNGLSAKEVQGHFGMTYKTAWSLLNKIRKMLKNTELLSDNIEMDETFFGGLESNKHLDKKNTNEKGNTKNLSAKKTLICLKSIDDGNMTINVEKGIKDLNLLTTDEWKAYKIIAIEKGLPHLTIEHKYEWYGRKIMNTETGEIININANGIEGIWAIIKKSLRNTYKRPSGKFLQSYLDEFTFRFNNRKKNVFLEMIKSVFIPND